MPAEDVVGLTFVDVTHPDEREAYARALVELVEGRVEQVVTEKRYVRPDGTVRWGRVHVVPLQRGDGAPNEWFSQTEDITERKAFEAARDEAEARYRALVDADVVSVFGGVDDRITEANDCFLELLDRTRHELESGALAYPDLTPADHADRDARAMERIRLGERATPYEKDMLRRDGTRVPILLVPAILSTDPVRWIALAVDLSERSAYEDRLRHIARTLQASLLPDELPDVTGFDVAARYRAAGEETEVGGDFYEVAELGGGRWAVTVGDVCGRGVEAATLTSLARHTLRSAVLHLDEPEEVLRWLNGALRRRGDLTFVSCLFGIIASDGRDRRVTFASAGHPLPVHVGAGTDEGRLVGGYGLLLGVVDQLPVTETALDLAPGDTLVLYTDGATDLPGEAALLPDEWAALVGATVAAADAGATAEDVADALLDALGDRRSFSERGDDLALLVLRATP